MKAAFGTMLCATGLCLLLVLPARAQERPTPPDATLRGPGIPVFLPKSPSVSSWRFRIPGKTVSQYTAQDWGAWIDSTWGPGQPVAQQLSLFDTFWDRVNAYWGGFPNLSLNWDSIRTFYRPQIGSGLSRGRFAALMSRVWMSLMEHHAYIFDMTVDTTFGSDNTGVPDYKAGVPLLLIGTHWWDFIGAPVTALQDSTGLVYRSVAGNPLALQPGDIILGYEGVPWKRLYPSLLEAGVPVNRYWSSPGSTPESRIQLAMSAVGWNWGMFDTMDVVKYATGDTVHLPTGPLATPTANIWASDQVPVPGVPMPEGAVNNTNAVSWGVVQGTNIGYIYVWDWQTSSTPQRFADAVSDLRYTRKVSGLIIDFRMNWGGEVQYANGGFARLFGFDPSSYWAFLTRASTSDHMSFSPIQLNFGFTPLGTSFDRPIAMLIGPGCLSAGDYNAFRLRFHPMARSFGRPTNGAFVAGSEQSGVLEQDWHYQYWPGLMVSLVPGEGYMIHKGVQPDESVWLTRDGVANGEDDVVKRALQWISTLTYAHDVQLNQNSRDTLQITARVENPLGHTAKVLATLRDGSNGLLDSLLLVDDGAHGDSTAGDGLWGFRYVPRKDDTIRVSIRTDDQTAGTSRSLPNVLSHVYTRRPIISVSPTAMSLGFVNQGISSRDTTLWVSNTGYSPDSIRVSIDSVNLTPSAAIAVRPNKFYLPGRTSQTCSVSVKPGLLAPNVVFRPKIIVTSDSGFGQARFETVLSFKVVITGVVNQSDLPTAFAVDQNYPNPFNPNTTIKYELPKSTEVRLSVFDMLGREVTVLVNERRDAGAHEAKFDASGLSSGMYFYRLQAGDFVQTRKLLLLR